MPNVKNYLAELFSGDDERAEAAVAKITALPEEPRACARTHLVAALESPRADQRWWATRALAALPDAQVVELLLRSLRDDDASVRQCAALGLRLHPDDSTAHELVRLLNDEDHLSAELAADALVEIGGSAVTALIEVLAGEEQDARIRAARALAQIGDTRAIPALFAVLDEDSAILEYWAEQGLERMGVGMAFFSPD
jgi:hypothetical protein